MQGFFETLAAAFLTRALSPGLAATLMAVAPKKSARAELKKIYVLNEAGDMAGEYVLDADCPVDYNDFLRALPDEGIGDRESLFVGEYVFTAFQSGREVFVLLSLGRLTPDDFDWTALLLNAAQGQFAKSGPRPPKPEASGDGEKALADREARIQAREAELAKFEVKLKADEANLRGRGEEIERQKARVTALADYVAQMQHGFARGAWRATQAAETWTRLAADLEAKGHAEDAKALADARKAFESERSALLAAKAELEGKVREATEQVARLEAAHREATAALQKEREENARREAESEKVRQQIEARVQELGQRFAAMAKERLVMSHKPTPEVPEGAGQAIEAEKAQLAKERRFLQRRAIEVLDHEERVRDREAEIEEREAALRRREEDLAAREADIERQRATLAQAVSGPTVGAEVDDARKDLERRVKIIQQKALDLLEREERLRKRAADLQALEERLAGKVPAN